MPTFTPSTAARLRNAPDRGAPERGAFLIFASTADGPCRVEGCTTHPTRENAAACAAELLKSRGNGPGAALIIVEVVARVWVGDVPILTDLGDADGAEYE